MNVLTVATVAGVFGSVYGLITSFLAGIFVASWGSGIASLLVLAAPIIGIVGAGIVKRKPFLGSGLMAISSGVMFFTIIGIHSAIFLLIGAILGVIGKYQS